MSTVTASTEPAPIRCVVWTNRQDPAVTPLLTGLTARNARVCPVTHPAQVMVELARGAKLLVIDRPWNKPAADRLLAAVRRHFRAVACWSYEPAGPGRPAVLDKLRHPAQPNPLAEPPQTDAPALISREELAMLLGPAGDES